MSARDTAERVCAKLRDAGYQALLVGGCVRDIILEREPADYDVATDATPERVLELFPAASPSGRSSASWLWSRARCRWKWRLFALI